MRRSAVSAIVLSGSLVALAGMNPLPAAAGPTAGPSGTVEIKMECANGTVTAPFLIEHLTGLNAGYPHPGYHVNVTVHTSNGDIGTGDESWYPAADGTRDSEEFLQKPVTAPDGADIVSGEGFDWQLIQTYGVQTDVLDGASAVDGQGCTTKPPKPHAPSLGGTSNPLHVSHERKFIVVVSADSRLGGHVSVKKRAHLIGSASFVTPASGKVSKTIKMTRKDFRHLKKVKHESVTLSASVHNSTGSASAARTVTLKAPKRP